MQVAVVILAGGDGRRIGGDKPLRPLAGRTLIDHAIELARRWSSTVAIAARDDRLSGKELPLLHDRIGSGPIAGLASGLAFASVQRCQAVLTLPCDTPLLPNDLSDRLAAAIGADKAALPVSGGRPHPSCGLWRIEASAVLPDYIDTGRGSLRGFAERIGHVEVEWPDQPFDPFFNVNDQQDLTAAEAILRNR